MVSALGYSSTSFNPTHPGRLCRGRERWIPGWKEADTPGLYRVVISGAVFSDDSARDARRGLTPTGMHIGALLQALFPERRLLAFREEASFPELPDYVGRRDEDAFLSPRRGGKVFEPFQRWRALVEDPDELHRLVANDLVDGFAVLGPDQEYNEALEESLYLLTSFGDSSTFPAQRFQPMALPETLTLCEAVICVHLDKHGPALGLYSAERMDQEAAICARAKADGVLAVPFAIPPMLARWDRALQELRLRWSETEEGEFPVPPAEEPTRWSRRRRRNGDDEE